MKEIALRDLCALREKVDLGGMGNCEKLEKEESKEEIEREKEGEDKEEYNQF